MLAPSGSRGAQRAFASTQNSKLGSSIRAASRVSAFWQSGRAAPLSLHAKLQVRFIHPGRVARLCLVTGKDAKC